MNYAFNDPNIPKAAEWLCASFSSDCNLTNVPLIGENYSNVFGLTSTLSDCFHTKNQIKGPSWVQIRKLQNVDRSITTVPMFTLKNPKHITLISEERKPPKFNICSFSLRTYFEEEKQIHHVLMLSVRLFKDCDIESFESNSVNATTFSKTSEIPKSDNVIFCKSEIELVTEFFNFIHEQDIDILFSYGLQFDWNLIFNTLQQEEVFGWWKCGRIRRGFSLPNYEISPFFYLCGRISFDLRILCNEFLNNKTNSLSSIVKEEFGQERQSLEGISILNEIETPQRLKNLIQYTERDSYYVSKLAEKLCVIPLSIQLSQLSGCPLRKVFQGLTNLRCEYLFLHTFSNLNYLIPERTLNKSIKREVQYEGGLVLEPKKGFYNECVMLLDFNSLYPSIICEYNLCFITLNRTAQNDQERIQIANDAKDLKVKGVLPMIMEDLLRERLKVKQKLIESNDKLTKQRLSIKQSAIKILSNAMYGYLGYPNSRFPAIYIAEIITCLGRYILQKTVDEITEKQFDVIYGDTDSVMVMSKTKDWKRAKEIAIQIGKEISSQYKYLKLGFENILLRLLLTNKKKYAALIFEPHNDNEEISFETAGEKEIRENSRIEIKGLEVIRRDWCGLLKYLGMFALDQFMYSDTKVNAAKEILLEVKRIAEMIRNNGQPVISIEPSYFKKKTEITLNDLVINKSITKPIEQYDPSKKAVNVSVAKWMMKHGYKVKANDVIPYIMVDNKAKDYDLKAVHPDNPLISSVDDADVEWYLSTQIVPPIVRLCEVFGMPTKDQLMDIIKKPKNQKTNAKTKYCYLIEPYFFCPYCNTVITIKKKITLKCTKCKNDLNWKTVYNRLTEFMCKLLNTYLCCGYGCSCGYWTVQLPMTNIEHTSPSLNKCKGMLQVKTRSVEAYKALKNLMTIFNADAAVGDAAILCKHMKDYIENIVESHELSRIKFTTILSVGEYE
ncbi:DNA-directed DNA polymerase [Histomonas meleagridis]|uniref:DNA-directed DNA polymerase n=1 Tax=Histomonas meleagridis TaxID=135588 RepID=UPI0035595E58|nr:DNA-directed DNA polymerase [Histomonas meleagridis]KAH0798943.1 DNA-directed DNA polymerase [Histomonas meleagridis]